METDKNISVKDYNFEKKKNRHENIQKMSEI